MAQSSKRIKRHQERITRTSLRPLDEALGIVKEMAGTKFRESVDVAINLGIDASKSDQAVRGSTVLPNGTGKQVKVAVFAQGDNAAKAKAAGADVVGFEDLAERMKGGDINFDTVIATPDAMRIVGQLGRVLGPRGLMPNPKVGTVTTDVDTAVRNAKSGQVRYRTDKAGIIHCPIGKADFEVAALRENLMALLNDIRKARPPQAKGQYLKRLTVSSTMGPGVGVDQTSLARWNRRNTPASGEMNLSRDGRMPARDVERNDRKAAVVVEDRRCPGSSSLLGLMGRSGLPAQTVQAESDLSGEVTVEKTSREGWRDHEGNGWPPCRVG